MSPLSGLIGRFARTRSIRWLDADSSHHAAVLVLEDVAVIDEGADGVWIAEIHAQAHARILQHASAVVGDVDRIAQKRLVDRKSGPVEQLEMKLVDVKI